VTDPPVRPQAGIRSRSTKPAHPVEALATIARECVTDMIAVFGGHVCTTELEDFLNTHPGVRQSAVHGVNGEGGHERICATVVTAPGTHVAAEDLRTRVREGRGAMYEPDRIEFGAARPTG
jgi:fatty-acyl-CoA synthase